MMNGAFLAGLATILAGTAIAVQAVFNNILSKHVGVWTANAVVHGTGFLIALTLTLLLGKNQFMSLGGTPWYSLLGGLCGVTIIASVVFALPKLNVGLTITILVISQIIVASLIDHYGWLGTPVVALDFKRIAGICLLILGALLIKK